MEESKFLEILGEIVLQYPLAANEKTTIKNSEYKRLFSRVKAKLIHMFPSLRQNVETLEYFVTTIVGFLDKPIVMLEYIRNKSERDNFLKNGVSKFGRLLLDSSKTRITNIRQLVQMVDLLEIEIKETVPLYFHTFRYEVEKILNEQNELVRISMYQNDEDLRKSDAKRVENARTLHEIVYQFCMSLATKQ